jgi:hypothetical protein
MLVWLVYLVRLVWIVEHVRLAWRSFSLVFVSCFDVGREEKEKENCGFRSSSFPMEMAEAKMVTSKDYQPY